MAKYFPMFINLEHKKIVVIGAGKIALRRITTLLEFGCKLIVISPKAEEEIKTYAEHGKLQLINREYRSGDCSQAHFVVAATDNREVNHQIVLECREENIIINACDCKEECDFYFPAVISEEDTVIGVTSSGSNHKRAKQVADKIRDNREAIFNIQKGMVK